jgi:CRISPR/Cas system-associated protein Cas10 (large subunit of type III CRISPR-Cas system)
LRNNRIDELRQAKKYQNILKEDENIVRGILVVISAYYDYKKHKKKIDFIYTNILMK